MLGPCKVSCYLKKMPNIVNGGKETILSPALTIPKMELLANETSCPTKHKSTFDDEWGSKWQVSSGEGGVEEKCWLSRVLEWCLFLQHLSNQLLLSFGAAKRRQCPATFLQPNA